MNESLPQIEKGIGQHHVKHVVSYSDSLPLKYQGMLEKAAERYSFVVLDRHTQNGSSNPPTQVAKAAVNEAQPTDGVFGFYRLDDDDLLPVTYFNQMAPYLSTAHVGWKVSFGKGLTGIRYAGQYYNIRQVYSPMIAIGLLSISRVTPGGDLVEPEEVSHSQSDSKHPVILDSRVPGFFWSRHAQQDTDMRPGVELSEDISQQRINALDREISHYPPTRRQKSAT